jgi:HEAT repeat protein
VAPTLLTALDDPAREVRAAAARSLGRLRATEAALPLVEALVSRRVPAGVGGEALLELGADVVAELSSIAGHPDPQVRAAALTLLGLVGDSGIAGIAIAGLLDPSADVRRAAAEALGRIGATPAESALRAALDDRVHYVRAAAAETLGVIDAPEALPKLVEIARTDRFRPARAAARAIGRIDPRRLRTAADEPDAGPHLHEASDLLRV